MWQIGTVEIENEIVAAPLAGISNPTYRKLNRDFGAGLTVSEMISDKALHYKSEKTFDMCRVREDEHPVSLQLFGSDPVTMGEAAQYLTENTTCDIIDINMGCPVQKVIKAHSGSYLLQNPDLAYDIVRAVKDHTNRPVTAKIRAGWDMQHINCDVVAQKLEQAGVDAIAIHGRTKSQLYTGKSNLEYIKRVKQAVKIPVIGNGDILTVEDARRMKEETQVDAIMIGRGLLGNPYLIQELLQGDQYQAPTYEDRINLCRTYAKDLCEDQSMKKGIAMMRGMSSWFLTGMPFASTYKARLALIQSLEDLNTILDEFVEKLNTL